MAEQNPKAANIKAEEIVDTSWLKKLESEGFFEKAYGGREVSHDLLGSPRWYVVSASEASAS